MIRRMYRYEVPIGDEWYPFELTSDPYHVAVSNNPDAYVVEFWAERIHDPNVIPSVRRFRVFATGQDLPDGAVWRGTCDRTDGFVWHLYEEA